MQNRYVVFGTIFFGSELLATSVEMVIENVSGVDMFV